MILIAAASISFTLRSDPLRSAARRQWAADAIAAIGNRANDATWLESELAKRRRTGTTRPANNWIGDEIVVARNGDWMICRSVCTKDEKTAVGKDLFIGRGSDGRWYYSTFHFCVGKCVLKMESRPNTLAEFVDGYWLIPFDARPENCLNETWDGSSAYGDTKIQPAASTQI